MAEDMIVSLSNKLSTVLKACLYSFLSVGPIPNHIAFILDGNRRYAKKYHLPVGMGHAFGYSTLLNMFKYCNELGIKYITAYAFSIDNFKRPPSEVNYLMEFFQNSFENLAKQDSIVNHYGIRVHIAGDLTLLSEPVRQKAERIMEKTRGNSNGVFTICIAYTSTNEILRAVQSSCQDKLDEIKASSRIDNIGMILNDQDFSKRMINIGDVEKHMDMAVAPDPDIVIRTSGVTRLSNFLLWQSPVSLLYSSSSLWPEIGLFHLTWAVIKFQRMHAFLNKMKKQQ